LLLKTPGRIILGQWSSEVTSYLNLNPIERLNSIEGPKTVFHSSLLRSWEGTTPLEQFLAGQHVDILYLDPSELAWLRAQPQAKNMLDNPHAAGWLTLGCEERGDRSWTLLAKM